MTTARAYAEAGNRRRALEEVEAALALDPEFLAAQSLRDRILSSPVVAPPKPSLPNAPPTFVDTELRLRPEQTGERSESQPGLPEGYARFEERAKRRRVDRRIEAARSAIDRKKLREAAAALEEVLELDPNLPELATLTAAFDQMRRANRPSHRGRGSWLAAAAVFGGMILGASWIEESRLLQSHPSSSAAPLVVTSTPAPIDAASPANEVQDAIGTSGSERPAMSAPPGAPAPVEAALTTHAPDAAPPAQLAKPSVQLALPPVQPSKPAPAPAITPPIEEPTVPPPVARAVAPAPRPLGSDIVAPSSGSSTSTGFARSTSSAANTLNASSLPNPTTTAVPTSLGIPVIPGINDESLVKQALQRYRVAYEGLDAESAQAVWPAVNQVALARAFDGLASQRLTFDACNVQVQGEHASATCRGTARYVPKIGSREPRIESRVWSFALRKIGPEWKIDNARAER